VTARAAREGGFALLIVLWTVGLIALVVTQLTAAWRTESQLASNLHAAALAEATADGAIHQAMFHLLAGTWRPDGEPRLVHVGDGVAELRIENLAGRLNPNMTPLPVMRQLLVELGAAPQQAAALAAAIEDWRIDSDEPQPLGAKAPQYRAAGLAYAPTGQPFRSLDEIGLVLGMRPDMLAALGPHVSVFQEGDTDPALADPVVAKVLSATGHAQSAAVAAPGEELGHALVAEITASAIVHNHVAFTRRAVVRFAAVTSGNPTPWRILAWDAPGE
jgi:general secretion pathway protein K